MATPPSLGGAPNASPEPSSSSSSSANQYFAANFMNSSPPDTPNPQMDFMSKSSSQGKGASEQGGGLASQMQASEKGIEMAGDSIAPGSGKAAAAVAKKTGVSEKMDQQLDQEIGQKLGM